MVVGDQLLLDAHGPLVRRPFAADVRLSLVEGSWVVTSVVPAFPDPPLPPLLRLAEGWQIGVHVYYSAHHVHLAFPRPTDRSV